MFDKIEKQIDAVFVVTPDHQHANPSLRAIKSGKHVYTEKCLTHDISEARILGDAARQSKVVTQMGNQGSGTGNHQLLAEYIQAGAIGKVSEVHAWCGWRPMRFGCRMDYPEGDLAEMPEVHWSEWLGPAKERFYSDYFRCEWYGWFDFATGSLGGWGTHVLDAVFFALKLKYPTSVELVEASELSDDRFPRHATIRFDFPPGSDGLQPPRSSGTTAACRTRRTRIAASPIIHRCTTKSGRNMVRPARRWAMRAASLSVTRG